MLTAISNPMRMQRLCQTDVALCQNGVAYVARFCFRGPLMLTAISSPMRMQRLCQTGVALCQNDAAYFSPILLSRSINVNGHFQSDENPVSLPN